MNVSLTPALEKLVEEKVKSGLYNSASEVIREALRLFEAYQSVQIANLSSLKSDIALGLADVQAGRVSVLDVAAIQAQGRAALQARSAKR